MTFATLRANQIIQETINSVVVGENFTKIINFNEKHIQEKNFFGRP